MEKFEDLSKLCVDDLIKMLSEIERGQRLLIEQGIREGGSWNEFSDSAKQIRCRLHELTGDWYGKPKVKLERPDDDLLNGVYDSPDQVPAEVMSWVKRYSGTLTSDATDAVRWARIADTRSHDRFQHGDITIYRAIGSSKDLIPEIRPGDWVTPSLDYAEFHLKRCLGGEGRILETTVDGRDVLASPTGDWQEAFYAPLEFSGPIQRSEKKSRFMRP